MKALAIFVLWVFLGLDVGAWAEALVGVPAIIGLAAGVLVGGWLAIEVRRRIVASAASVPQAAVSAAMEAAPLNLDPAA